MPNIKCSRQYEVDLLAIDSSDSKGIERYHIESGVSISGPHSKLTAKEYSLEKLRNRVQQASQRRTIGFFINRKFEPPEVTDELSKYGFQNGNYKRVIVSWGWTPEAEDEAKKAGITLWDFRDILHEIAYHSRNLRTYFTDDTLRTIQLFVRST